MTVIVVIHLLAPFLYNEQQHRLYTLPEWLANELQVLHDWLDPISVENTQTIPALLNDTPKTVVEQEQQRPSIISINQRYLGTSIEKALQTTQGLTVKSPMGSGKTEAVKKLIKTGEHSLNFAFVSPRTKLNRSIAKELNAHFYKDVLKQSNRKKRKAMAKRVVGTLQFFRTLLKEFPDLKYDLLIMDESQATARMLVSNITRHQEEVLTTVKKMANEAKKVIAMDAHLGRETEQLMAILLNEPPVLLLNNATPWSDINAEILTGGRYRDRKKANDALQMEMFEQDKKFTICSASVTYCELRYEVLTKKNPEKKIGLITAEESKEAQALVDNPALIREYDVLILSPAVDIGVSFNEQDHMHVCFGVFPNKRGTSDSYSALQMLARIRSLIDKRWIITLDDEHPVFTHMPTIPAEISIAMTKRLQRNIAYAGLKDKQPDNETHEQLIALFETCEHIHRDNKNHYNHYFMQELKTMNVMIHHRSIKDILISKTSEKQTQAAKESIKQRHQHAKTDGKEIDRKRFEQIDIKRKHHLEIVTDDEKDSHTAFLFREKYAITAWEMSEAQKQHYLSLDEIGAVEKCNNRDLLHADSRFIKKVIAVQLEGMGKKKALKENAMSKKHNLLLVKKLLSYANDYSDGTAYSHQILKDGKMVRFVTKHYKEIVALEVIALPNHWKQKPATLMNLLLRLLGYTIKSTRKRNGKRNKNGNQCFDNHFSAQAVAEIDALFNDREQQQQTWGDVMQKRMDKQVVN